MICPLQTPRIMGEKKIEVREDFQRNIRKSKMKNGMDFYLLPVSAALLPPAAPWCVEIPYPFAVPQKASDHVTAVIRRLSSS